MRDEYKVMVIAWALVAGWIAFVIFANRRQHPRVLFFLFMVELWERFSYYGMRAFLILYLTREWVRGGFGFDKPTSYGIYGAFTALVYLTPLAGGSLADRILGSRKAIIWGALLMAAGQFVLSASNYRGGASQNDVLLLYAGLGILAMGNGFFKPNISSMIGRFYKQGDHRRDGAFTIFYMGINIGAFLAPLTCGTVAELEGWGYGFLLAGIGMVAGLTIFLVTSRLGLLEDKADPPPTARQRVGGVPVEYVVYLASLAVVPVGCLLIYRNVVMDYLLAGVGLFVIGYILWLSFQYPIAERQRLWVITTLLFFTAVFWTFFELAGSALSVFTDNNVEHRLFGVPLTTSNFQAFNALFIMIFAPVFSVMWTYLGRRGLEPAAPVKFAIALLLIGAGFFVLDLGVPFARDAIIPALFLVLLYLLHTLGELSLSPVGLSLVTKLSPARIVAFVMGFWFLANAVAQQAGKHISDLTAVDENATKEESLRAAMTVFNEVGLFAIGSGVLLLLLSPILRRWMHGIR